MMEHESISERLKALKSAIGFPPGTLTFEEVSTYLTNPNCYSLVESAYFQRLPALLSDNLPHQGDLVVCGVWRGGSALYLQAINQWQAYQRKLWLFDTFDGFHRETFTHPKDLAFLKNFNLGQPYRFPTSDEVRQLFERFDLWTEQVFLTEGPLQRTLSSSNLSEIAFLHLDVDFYQPTLDALDIAYPRLVEGAIVLVDDYGVPQFGCRDAVDAFRKNRHLTAPIYFLNDHIAYWIHHA